MKFLDTDSLTFEDFFNFPPAEFKFAVLSYTWCTPADELTCRGAGQPASRSWLDRHAAGDHRIRQACERAQRYNIRYLWVDTICIDQASSADVVEAVVGSFNLVWNAALCMVHLSDLLPTGGSGSPLPDLEKSLSGCQWFTRGWTLQELVAGQRVEFFDRDFNLRGTKESTSPRSWLEMLSRVSGVDTLVLAERDLLHEISLGRRLSWAAGRHTTRPEDVAYALLGICGVGGRLTPRYGEGPRAAFFRLQKKILECTTDLSILAWKREQQASDHYDHETQQPSPPALSGVLAHSPADFRHFASHSAWMSPFQSDCELQFNNRGLRVSQALLSAEGRPQRGNGREFVLLLAHTASMGNVGISLKEVKPGLFVRADPHGIASISPVAQESARAIIDLCLEPTDRKECCRMLQNQRGKHVSAWIAGVSQSGHPTGHPTAEFERDLPEETASADQKTSVASGTTDFSYPATPPRWNKQPLKRNADAVLKQDGCGEEDDHDVLLFDSLPEQRSNLKGGHHFWAVVPTLVTSGLGAWNDEKAKRQQHSSDDRPRPHKRARTTAPETEEENGCGWSSSSYTAATDCDDPDAGLLLVGRRQNPRPIPKDAIACPFYKRDPARYHNCMWGIELSDLRSLRQHVIVHHHQPDYCPICRSLFDSAADRDCHIISRSCSRPETLPPLPAGVSEDQVGHLVRLEGGGWKCKVKKGSNVKGGRRQENKSMAAVSEQEKWFLIWDIVFPGAPRPLSAYLSSRQEREAAGMRQFWEKAGPGIVASFLKKEKLLRWTDLHEEADLAALHGSVLQGMMEASGLVACSLEDC